MATQQAQYKKYKRGQRQASVETDYSNGMMFSEGAVTDGYVKTLVNFDFTQDGRNALKPRAALITSEVIVPDMPTILDDINDDLSLDDYLDEDVVIKAAKECVENGIDYKQFILGKPDVIEIDNEKEVQSKGKIWVITVPKRIKDFEDILLSESRISPEYSDCAFYSAILTKIHNMPLIDNVMASSIVGTFMGNSFYFFDDSSEGTLKKTVFDNTSDPANPRYVFSEIDPVTPTASEAVNYGYNMLLHPSSNPYSFSDSSGAAAFEMEGILPYGSEFTIDNVPELIMTPKANTRIWFRCNYNIPTSNEFKIIWSWKEVSGTDDWTQFAETNLKYSDFPEDDDHEKIFPELQADLIVPEKEILIRCEAYDLDSQTPDIVQRAMTVGFDFSTHAESTVTNIAPDKFDLSTATGMYSWRNRLVLWGVTSDPTILFLSDLDEPAYFPYPNNVIIFEEPIVSVTELMDTLIVFTKSKVYQVSVNPDGYTWSTTVIQSNLYIDAWDKHLIQTVRNMVYFKSGNYYYMIVPKAQSTTGELTLAPITTPITDFFDHFSVNVSSIFKDCFKELDDDNNLVLFDPTVHDTDRPGDGFISYYNFLDYECVHNFYVFKYRDAYVHFDIIYNIVNRYWKINIYESAHYLFPYKNDATQSGVMAGTSVMSVYNAYSDTETSQRFIQLFRFNTIKIADIYIPSYADGIVYDLTHANISFYPDEPEIIDVPSAMVSDYVDEVLYLNSDYVRTSKLQEEILWLINDSNYVSGFSEVSFKDIFDENAESIINSMTFPNRQMLDTGYRDANLFVNKRYRELQLQINNPDNDDMEFGMDFQVAGEPRNTDFLYEVSQVIDELYEDKGIVYIDATPYMAVDAADIDKINMWTIRHDIGSSIKVSLWKVRASVSGKGMAPRLRLFTTRKMFNFQLLGINWIYREMNMR